MIKAASRVALTLLAGGNLCAAAHADHPEIAAGVNVQQIQEVQLSGQGDDVTYTEVAGDVAYAVRNRRVVLSASYRLSYRIPESGKIDQSLSQDGLMRAEAKLIDEWLTLDAGAIVTRSRVDPGGAAPQTNSPNAKNLTQTYSTFVQPTLAHHFGDLGFSISYRRAYTKNKGHQTGLAFDPLNNRFDDSTNQQATATFTMPRGELPWEWTTAIQYAAEDASNLAKQSRSLSATHEIVVPISHSIAAVASAGYETIKISERRALLDPLTGAPVRDLNGRFIADPGSPRVLTYDLHGLIADAGIIWRPSHRTRLEARAGYRYGGLTVTGLLEMKPSQRTGIVVRLTDRVESYGASLSSSLAASPADLDLRQSTDPGSAYQNCLFGKSTNGGRCIGGALGQASASNYRERAADIIVTHRTRRWTMSGTAGYSRRTYIDTPGTLFSLAGVVDQIFFGEMSFSGVLTRKSGVSFSFRGNLFKNGVPGAADVQSGSFSTDYYRSFGRGLRLDANFSIDASKQDGNTADVSGRARVGLQYHF